MYSAADLARGESQISGAWREDSVNWVGSGSIILVPSIPLHTPPPLMPYSVFLRASSAKVLQPTIGA